MKVTVELDTAKIQSKVERNLGRVQYVLDNRVAADSNYFCPRDTGNLQGSVFPIQGTGELEWNTTYAKKQYYTGENKSKDSNPNASMHWFEQAKARDLREWERVANEEYNR